MDWRDSWWKEFCEEAKICSQALSADDIRELLRVWDQTFKKVFESGPRPIDVPELGSVSALGYWRNACRRAYSELEATEFLVLNEDWQELGAYKCSAAEPVEIYRFESLVNSLAGGSDVIVFGTDLSWAMRVCHHGTVFLGCMPCEPEWEW